LPEPEEDAETFEGNAAIKAVYYARATGMVCLADDSGLMVDALGGAPGVRSARYAGGGGVGATRAERDAANNAKLLGELAGVPDAHRTARFVCAMVLASPAGEILATTRGTFEGRIGLAPKGSNGFGYDPLLVIDDGRTSADLSEAEKNARSHRGEAARAMVGEMGRRE
jgi:XTP/dITP diphosphohydrolase